MRSIVCDGCGESRPMSETCLVDGRPLCGKCASEMGEDELSALSDEDVVRQTDPTICVRCGADNGEHELRKVAGCPVCEACDHEMRHRPFPGWVKLSMAGLLLLAAITLAENSRFLLGYAEIQQAFRAFSAGDLKHASSLMRAAADRVPERYDIGGMASLFLATDLMRRHRFKDALPQLQRATALLLPRDRWRGIADERLLVVESALAFDAKDYDTFLAKSRDLYDRQPQDPFAQVTLASAYACQYAIRGQEEDKQQALDLIAMASRSKRGNGMQDYQQRILHRLSTRKIVSGGEIQKHFPHGWHEEPKP